MTNNNTIEVISVNEQSARELAMDKKRLLKRILETKSCLVKKYKDQFKKYTYDFENKRIISENGKYILQWGTRDYPLLPESYHNQQTNQGSVYFFAANVLNNCKDFFYWIEQRKDGEK